jgi:hypothetical protein
VRLIVSPRPVTRTFGGEGLVMAKGFHAVGMEASPPDHLLSFWSQGDDQERHYFVIQRSEESSEEAVPDLANVYLELDDQSWGGYGGIERVELGPGGLTVRLGRRWATERIGTDTVRVTFALSDDNYRAAAQVLRLILFGYEDRLEVAAEPGRAPDRGGP